jgi:hypothetical protein
MLTNEGIFKWLGVSRRINLEEVLNADGIIVSA